MPELLFGGEFPGCTDGQANHDNSLDAESAREDEAERNQFFQAGAMFPLKLAFGHFAFGYLPELRQFSSSEIGYSFCVDG